MFKILLVGGDGGIRSDVIGVVEGKDTCELVYARDAQSAIDRVAKGDISLALLLLPVAHEIDIIQSGSEFLVDAAIARRNLATVVIMEDPNVDLTLCFLQLGAVECLCQPLSVTRLSLLIDIITASTLRQNLAYPFDDSSCENFLRQSPTMATLIDEVRLVARLETTVLLSGETGTGKTSLAHMIHACSPHRKGHFVTVNCGSLTSSLIESELFGHQRGAFTGADRDQPGKFSAVGRGTLFLDDIDTLPMDVQSKFLRAIEERQFEALGSAETQQLEARLIAATNKDLEKEVAEGRFRSDLYYRLNVASFRLPPLREREGEIGLLARYFLMSLAAEHGLGMPQFNVAAANAMQTYDWPGNVRELRNTIEHCLIISSGMDIDLEHLPERIRRHVSAPEAPIEKSASSSLREVRLRAERAHLVAALRRYNNNRSRTAEALGISRAALYKRLHKHCLQ